MNDRSDSSSFPGGCVLLGLGMLALGGVLWATLFIGGAILTDRINRVADRQGVQQNQLRPDLAAAGGAFPDQAQALPVAVSDQAKAQAYDASLPPASAATVKEITLETTDNATFGIAKDVNYTGWTFGGSVPSHPLHVRQGDTVKFTLTNKGTMGHSMDFHAAQINPGENFRTVLPGDSFSFDWKANSPGVFLFHCGTAPVIQHIGNGMYGAVIVDPATPLPAAKEFALVQSEFYIGDIKGNAHVGDLDKMLSAKPDYVVFNGMVNQYVEHPLTVNPNDLIRLYVVNAGPSQTSAFHVIGALFSAVYPDGNPANKLSGVSTYNVPAGGGAMFELRIPDEGTYPFVTHSFADASKGAVGVIQVGNPPKTGPDAHAAGSAPPAAATIDQTMTDNKFSQKEMTAKAGETTAINVTNKGAAIHNVRIQGLPGEGGKDAQTTLLQGGQSATLTISPSKPGSYKFVCDVHPTEMTGTLTVK